MDPSSEGAAGRHSLRHVRRMSNWTAAVLIAGTGTATAALAHQASQTAAAPPAAGTAAAAAGTPRPPDRVSPTRSRPPPPPASL
jgi:hypothetical protein